MPQGRHDGGYADAAGEEYVLFAGIKRAKTVKDRRGPKSPHMTARLHALLRRRPDPVSTPLRVGSLRIDPARHQALIDGADLGLTAREFDLLEVLARHPGIVLSREQLLADVWGYQHAGDTRLVNVHVQRLRGKVEVDPESPEIIVTVRGVGYRAGPP